MDSISNRLRPLFMLFSGSILRFLVFPHFKHLSSLHPFFTNLSTDLFPSLEPSHILKLNLLLPLLLRIHHLSQLLSSNLHMSSSFVAPSSKRNNEWETSSFRKEAHLDHVDLPSGKKKWIYKIKTHSDGSIECYKAHLFVKGHSPEYNIDYEEPFTAVARMTFVRILLAIATAK